MRRATMTYFCMRCWQEIDNDETVCPACGTDQELLNKETFVRKLIRSLHHPDPETPIRAAYVLGKLKAQEAVPALIDVIHQSHDFYVVAAAIEALGEIGDAGAIKVIQELLTQKTTLPVRFTAERVLKKLTSA